MTTKNKIISGFIFMMVLLAILVGLGFRSTQRSTENATEYRRLSMLNVGMSDFSTGLQQASANIYAYIHNRDEKLITASQKAADSSRAAVDRMRGYAVSDGTKKLMEELTADMATFNSLLTKMHNAVVTSNAQYSSVVIPNVLKSAEALNAMTDMALEVNNSRALGRISAIWSKMVAAASSLSRFSQTMSVKDEELAKGFLKEVDDTIMALSAQITTAEGRSSHQELKKTTDQLIVAFQEMEAQAQSLRAATGALEVFLNEAFDKAAVFNLDIDKRMLARGQQNLVDNQSALNTMFTLGGLGLLFGTVIAVLVVVGIVRVLKSMEAYAKAVAQGDFDYPLAVREKGEIGGVAAAVLAIPATLQRLIDAANHLAENIRQGSMRERLDTDIFTGEFARLGQAVNTVGEAYTDMLDYIPIPIMASGKDYTVRFFNKAGQDIVGGNNLHSPCKNEIRASACSTENCLGKRAMSSGTPITDETEACPMGVTRKVSVTAVPLTDAGGEICGFFETLVDITEIRTQQATMLQVAREATEISDRVASAAEELAAQVEQISHGAEVQRDRVTSTASAMAQMNATVLEVARNAGEASQQSDQTRAKAENGEELVNLVVSSIDTMNTVGESLRTNMQELGTLAEGIGGVMNVITDIADQTNLLALNAAIEAARAGEAGRGFAVVADEVRKLAEKTMEATKEVGGTISAIQQSARVNQAEVARAVESVSEATARADDSGKALQEIVNIASGTSEVVASIATAAEEQSATSEEINNAIEEINRIVIENTDGMTQSSAAVQELSAMARKLKTTMEDLH
ncbi:methyl-accepting chemotaxis protein [Desulfovibrio sp. OttesenSCG-928-G11]|nr:methyl-accepting chemotaxis protein [Desulfovibrio sp. OttesenSCG-928-G11]